MSAADAQLLLLLGWLAVASITDLRARRVPLWVTLPAAVTGLVMQAVRFEWAASYDRGLLWGVLGWLATALVPYLLWRSGPAAGTEGDGERLAGGGDVFLFASVGAFYGVKDGMGIQLVAFLVGAVFWLGGLSWRGELFRTLWVGARHIVKRVSDRDDEVDGLTVQLPFAPILLLAAILYHRDQLASLVFGL